MGAASERALISQEEIPEHVSHNSYHGNYIDLVSITTTEWSPILNSEVLLFLDLFISLFIKMHIEHILLVLIFRV